ncbi:MULTISPECIES: entericidin A/B family lipoprotein [Pasteurellaceae]|nr:MULTISPECIES: entericidin A/B family lipoprotein [Pasteurellaceae]
MKKLMSLILASAFVLALTGCETTKGVGKDIQHAGEKVEQVVTK